MFVYTNPRPPHLLLLLASYHEAKRVQASPYRKVQLEFPWKDKFLACWWPSIFKPSFLCLFLYSLVISVEVWKAENVNGNLKMTQRAIAKWWSHYNKCTLLVWGKNTNLGVLSVTIYLLRNKVHSSEHTKHASPGPLHNSSHCWAGP